ncbi:hypothetical protein LINPERHAP2_LOCUS3785 [Linum perenne]
MLKSNFCWAMTRLHTSTPLRSPVSVRCWIWTRWSKWNIYIYRKGNRPVDYLAVLDHNLSLGFHVIDVFILSYNYIRCMTYLKFSYFVRL